MRVRGHGSGAAINVKETSPPHRDDYIDESANPALGVPELMTPEPFGLVAVAQPRGHLDRATGHGRRKLAELLRPEPVRPSRHTACTVATEATVSATAA
jgi:hypothetical protein